jgi:catecholate siderophore receptor
MPCTANDLTPCAAPEPASASEAASPPASPIVSLGALAAGFGLALGSQLAAAQTPAAADGATLPAVTIKARAEESARETLQTNKTSIGKGRQDIRDIPQSITVVTEKLLQEAKLDTLRSALRYTAGITFAATENGTDQDIRMRGFPVATTGDLMMDGMKDPSQYDRDTFNLDRLEVMRGSASMLFGRGSTGGVINQVTKKPLLETVNEVIGTYGSGSFGRLTADVNVRTGEEAAVRVNAMVTKAHNFGATVDKVGFAPSMSWGIGSRDEFTVGLFYLNVDNRPPHNLRYLSGTVAEAIPANRYYGTASDFLRGEATYLTGSWLRRLDDGGRLHTQLRTGVYERNVWPTTVGYCSRALTSAGACPAGSPAVTLATLTGSTAMTRTGLAPRKDTIRGTYLQSDYTNTFKASGLRHDVTGGVDMALESADRYGAWGPVGTNYNKGGTAVDQPDDGRLTAATPIHRPTSDYSGKAFGVYAQDLLWLNPQWKLLGGLRYDYFGANMHQLVYPNATTNQASGVNSSQLSYRSLISYRAGVLYQPTPLESYHLSYGTSFNTSADTYQYTTQQIANVPAEKSRNIELGAKLDWLDGQLSTRGAIFHTEKYNERTTDADFAGNFPVLSGKRHSQGVEFDVVGRLTPKLEVYLSYAWMHRAKIDRVGTAATGAGSPVGLTPRHTGALWLSYQMTPRLRLAGGLRGASENRPLQGTSGAASTTAKTPGFLVYDAMAEYTFNRDLFAQLNVQNLTNKVYGDQLYPGFYTPGPGRLVKATIGWRF